MLGRSQRVSSLQLLVVVRCRSSLAEGRVSEGLTVKEVKKTYWVECLLPFLIIIAEFVLVCQNLVLEVGIDGKVFATDSASAASETTTTSARHGCWYLCWV